MDGSNNHGSSSRLYRSHLDAILTEYDDYNLGYKSDTDQNRAHPQKDTITKHVRVNTASSTRAGAPQLRPQITTTRSPPQVWACFTLRDKRRVTLVQKHEERTNDTRNARVNTLLLQNRSSFIFDPGLRFYHLLRRCERALPF